MLRQWAILALLCWNCCCSICSFHCCLPLYGTVCLFLPHVLIRPCLIAVRRINLLSDSHVLVTYSTLRQVRSRQMPEQAKMQGHITISEAVLLLHSCWWGE